MHLAYPVSLQAIHSNVEKQIIQIYNMTGQKTPTGRRQPVGYFQA